MAMAIKGENILFGIGGLLAGMFAGGVAVAAAVKSRAGMDMAVDTATKKLSKLTGVAFEKAFLKAMIMHHQAGVNMARLVESRTDRNELKALCDDIIKTQSQEIADMNKWQQKWGFASGETAMRMRAGE